MVFSSLIFIFLFLPITLLMYYIIPKKYISIRNFVLLLTSLAFYSWGEPKYIFLMIFSIVINYVIGILMDKYKGWKKFLLIISIVINVSFLIYFKYFNLFVSTANGIFKTSVSIKNIALPIGISFYTFQILSYVIDVYRQKVKAQKNIVFLATYITFFPQLIAGPIVRYIDIEKSLKNRNESLELFSSGVRRFIIGLSKKVIIANNVAIVANIILDRDILSVGTFGTWIALLCYTLQIYFDFSGYSDMAIGLGKMFGFNFMENFNYPYIATSITDFWRRWHISLSTWFRDYIYIPLGGNRVSTIKWIRNILIVWTLTGFWHGASWNFLIWGLYYGIILLIEKKILSKFLNKLPKILQHIYSLFLIMLGWLIFKVEDMNNMLEVLKSLFTYSHTDISELFMNKMEVIPCFIYIVLGIVFCTPIIRNIYNNLIKKNSFFINCAVDVIIFGLFILSYTYLLTSTYNPFIYFRF